MFFFNICNSLNPEQFAHFQQFLKAVTLCFSVMLGSLWYGVPAACEWVSVMKIYKNRHLGSFVWALSHTPYGRLLIQWATAAPTFGLFLPCFLVFAMCCVVFYVIYVSRRGPLPGISIMTLTSLEKKAQSWRFWKPLEFCDCANGLWVTVIWPKTNASVLMG